MLRQRMRIETYKQKVSEKKIDNLRRKWIFFFPPRIIYSREKKKTETRTSDATKRRQLNRDERNKRSKLPFDREKVENRSVIARDTGSCKNIVKNLRHLSFFLRRKCCFFSLSQYSGLFGHEKQTCRLRSDFFSALRISIKVISISELTVCLRGILHFGVLPFPSPSLSRKAALLHSFASFFSFLFTFLLGTTITQHRGSDLYRSLRKKENLRKTRPRPRYISIQAITRHATNA